MQLILSGRHVSLTPTLNEHAKTQLLKLEKFSSNITRIQLTLHSEKYRQCIEARMIAAGIEHHAEVTGNSWLTALEQLRKKLSKQLVKDKHHLKQHKKTLIRNLKRTINES